MRLFCLFLVFFSAFYGGCFAQNTLEYRIVVDPELVATDTIVSRGNSGKSSVSFTVLDEDGAPYPFLKVGLASEDSTYYGLTNVEGNGSFQVPPGKYEIVFSDFFYGLHTESVLLGAQENYHLEMQGLAQHAIYTVRARKELSPEDLEGIRKCLMQHEPDQCSTDAYLIAIEI